MERAHVVKLDESRDVALEMLQENQYYRWLGGRGKFSEIAKPLSAIVGPVTTRSLDVPKKLLDGFVSSSPSICKYEDRRVGIIRTVNYRQAVGGLTLFRKKQQKCITRNFWVEFDENWNPQSFSEMRDPKGSRPGAVQGYEDCRVFHSAGKFWASCNFAERPQLIGRGSMNLLCEMAVLELSDAGEIRDVYAIRGPWSTQHQKNWKPAPTDGDPLRWIYSSDPLTLVTPEMATEDHSLKWEPDSLWRGGSQAIPYGGGWLWIDHRPVVGFDGMRNLYLHRFVFANKDLTTVQAVSPNFVFNNFGIEFCAGMAIDWNKILITYSVRDAFGFLAECSLKTVLNSLVAV